MNELEILLDELKDSYMPFVTFIKAFLLGYYIKPSLLERFCSVLKERRVSFEKKEENLEIKSNEFLDWIDKDDEKELLTFQNKFKELHPKRHCIFRDLKYIQNKKKDLEKSNHKHYPHDFKYLINQYKVIILAKKKQVKIENSNDLKNLHCLLFGKEENRYADYENEVYYYLDDGSYKTVYRSPKEKEVEIEKAFACYEEAISSRSDLAFVFEFCLFQKLLRIHPFLDGNGRTLRMMLLIRLYELGYQDIFHISFDYLVQEYKRYYIENSDIRILYIKKKDVVDYQDPILYRNFIFFMQKLLLVGMKDNY